MRHRLVGIAAVAALIAFACGPSFSVTPERIEKDIVGKTTSVDGLQWRFAADEPRKIKIIETDEEGKTATAVIEIVTEGSFNPAPKMAGRLRLHYEWIADQWNLLRVENLTFKPI
jgi:hypothetical protein